MIRKLVVFSLFSFVGFVVNAQTDYFRVRWDLSGSLAPIFIAGPNDINAPFASNSPYPIYEYQEVNGLLYTVSVHIGLNIPVYRTDNWSVGFDLSAGGGQQRSLKDAEGLQAFFLDFPQYVYYRNYKGNFDYSFRLGYKYTATVLSHHLMMGAFDIHFDDTFSLRFYGSFFRYRYYAYYTDDRYKPNVKIGDFGIALVGYF